MTDKDRDTKVPSREARGECEIGHGELTAKDAPSLESVHEVKLDALGLSHRGIETAFCLFSHRVDHVSSWRDIQGLGQGVKRRLPKDKARIVGVDETWVRIKGEARLAGVVVDVGGRVLNIELTGEGFDYEGWFKSMTDELGVEVVVTNDSTDYAIPTKGDSVIRQQCLVHMNRTVGRAKGRLPGDIRDRCGGLLNQIIEMVEGQMVATRTGATGETPAGRWRQMTLHQRRTGVPNSTNRLEGRFGRIKPRYRMTRGLKTDSGSVNFMAVVCGVLAQSSG